MAVVEVDVREACRLLDVSAQVVRKAIRAGHIVARSRGMGPQTGLLIDLESLQRWAAARGRALAAPTGESVGAVFTESAVPLFADLPLPSLPPVKGSARDALAYVELCNRFAAAGLRRAAALLKEKESRPPGND